MEKRKYQRLLIPHPDGFKCPQCASRVHWSCRGRSGYAYCSKSSSATRLITPGASMFFCEWEGKVRRRRDGEVEIIYIEEL